MKFTRTFSLFYPAIVFGLFLFISLLQIFEYHPNATGSEYAADHVFFYSINTILWISGAVLVNGLLHTFLWGGLFKGSIENIYKQVLSDFTSILIYLLACGFILTKVFFQPLDNSWIVVFIVLLFLGTAFRRKVLAFSKSSFLRADRAFNLGDWIELIDTSSSREIIGEVTDVNMRNIKLKTEAGTIITISSMLLGNYLINNYSGTNEEVRFDLSFNIDQFYPMDRVQRIMLAGAEEEFLNAGLNSTKRPIVVINKLEQNRIEYVLYYWSKPWEAFSPVEIKNKLYNRILYHFNKAGFLLYNNNFTSAAISNLTESLSSFWDIDSPDGVEQLLRRNVLLNILDDREIESLSNLIHPVIYEKGATLIKQDDSGNSLFILIEGLLEVHIKSENNTDINVAYLSPGEFFGEMSLLTGEPRSATVKAVVESAVYEITKDNLYEIITNRPDIVEELSETVTKRHLENIQKMEKFESSQGHFHLMYQQISKQIKRFFKL